MKTNHLAYKELLHATRQFVCLLFIITLAIPARAQIDLDWAYNPKDSVISGDETYSETIVIDGSDNVVVAGYFSEAASFSNGIGVENLIAYGGDDIFLAKYNSTGELVFAENIGLWSAERARAVTSDKFGNILITGEFFSLTDLDPTFNEALFNSNGSSDVFFAKYDSLGNYVFGKQIGGEYGDIAYSISTDSIGNIFITGGFSDTVDFDPGPGVFNLVSNGSYDVFLAKFDPAGNFINAISFGGTNSDNGYSVVVNSTGSVVLTGAYYSVVDFDPGVNIVQDTAVGYSDIFIAKFTSSLDYKFSKSFGGASFDIGNSIVVDSENNIYIAGNVRDTIKIEINNNLVVLPPNGNMNADDIFIARFDTAGNCLSASVIGGSGYDYVSDIAVDKSFNIFITGQFWSTADFDPGSGISNLTAVLGDAYIAKYDSSGNFVFSKKIGGPYQDNGVGISVSEDGRIYTTGTFRGTTDFDPGSGVFNLVATTNQYQSYICINDSSGNLDTAQLMGCKPFSVRTQYGTSVTSDKKGNSYFLGDYTSVVDFDPGTNIFNLRSEGYTDVYFAKYNNSGALVYAKSVGGLNSDESSAIAVDDSGNVFIAGVYRYSADFDPGPGVALLTNGNCINTFFAKYDSLGNYIFAKSIDAGISGIEDISLDRNGCLYITGGFSSTVDFDPGPGVSCLTSVGLDDIYIAKYSHSGDYIYSGRIGGPGSDDGWNIVIDKENSIYLAGDFNDTVDFDFGSGVNDLITLGETNVFFAKYDSLQNLIYSKCIVSDETEHISDMKVDSLGNVYICGWFYGSSDFDPGPGTFLLSASGVSNGFWAKYNSNGEFVFAHNFGVTGSNAVHSTDFDTSGNMYITGKFLSTVDFDPGPGSAFLTNAGTGDIFIAMYDSVGNFRFCKKIGGCPAGDVYPAQLDVSATDKLLLTGHFRYTADFDPGVQIYYLQPFNDADTYLASFIPSPEIEIVGNLISISDGDNTPSLSDSTDFGFITEGDTIYRSFIIRNVGLRTLLLQSVPNVEVTGSGYFLRTDAPDSVMVNDSAIFTVGFSAASCGTYYGHVTVPSNDKDEQVFEFAISCTIADTDPPFVPVLNDTSSQCSLTPEIPETFDVCAGVIHGTASVSFPIETPGLSVITWTFDDGNGNIVTANQNVTIIDTLPPVFNCLSDVSKCFGDSVDLSPVNVSDNCSGQVSISFSLSGATTGSGSDDASNEAFNNGITKISYYFTDIAGNMDSCSFFLTQHPNYFSTQNEEIFLGDSMFWMGQYYAESGLYLDTLQSSFGCDSIFELNLSVISSIRESSGQISIYPNPANDIIHIAPGNSCDFTVKLVSPLGVEILSEHYSESNAIVDLKQVPGGNCILMIVFDDSMVSVPVAIIHP